MNYWLEKRKEKARCSVSISMDGQKAKLRGVKVNIIEAIKTLELTVEPEKQDDNEIIEFYDILSTIFIDLSSLVEPQEAMIKIMPNSQTKERCTLAGAVALSTNFQDATNGMTIKIIFSYRTKREFIGA